MMSGNDKIKKFKEKLEIIKKNNDKLVINNIESGMTITTVMYIDYIGERWARGHSIIYRNGEEVEVPESINYGDVVSADLDNGYNILFPSYLS